MLQHVTDRAQEQERLKTQLSCRELAQLTAGGALGRVLGRLGLRSISWHPCVSLIGVLNLYSVHSTDEIGVNPRLTGMVLLTSPPVS